MSYSAQSIFRDVDLPNASRLPYRTCRRRASALAVLLLLIAPALMSCSQQQQCKDAYKRAISDGRVGPGIDPDGPYVDDICAAENWQQRLKDDKQRQQEYYDQLRSVP